ncbi:MAG: alanine/glycine:cation symporter family protein [Phycisphaerales bacterium]
MDWLWGSLDHVNGVIWHNVVLYVVLGVGLLFTIWSGFSQFRALTHGTAVIRGKYDDKNDPGAINHFQALSAALSATVGLGNIGGVALAVALGGPGAIFWMWVVGILGMAIKTTEVTLSMLYRNTDDPDNPHGGPMFVAKKAFKERGFGALGTVIGGLFVLTLLVSTITGGNMFQAWNVAEITNNYTGVPTIAVGIVLAIVVGMVIIGGIKRIGAVAGRIVPLMCGLYVLAALVVIIVDIGRVPEMFGLIFTEAFSKSSADEAFLGGTAGYALLWGMKRALFSSEAGQGSSPIAHSAAKTDEPVREGIVAGLEPFIDTIVVCTLTALVILLTGAWNRGAEATLDTPFQMVQVQVDDEGNPVENTWTIADTPLPGKNEAARKVSGEWVDGDEVFIVIDAHENSNTGLTLHRLAGRVKTAPSGDGFIVEWKDFETEAGVTPKAGYSGTGVFKEYSGATLTAYAFDSAIPGLGMWLVTLASWLFAISTMISWSYYGEQGVVYFFGDSPGAILVYKVLYCLAIVIATAGFVTSDAQLDSLTALGTGVMLWANIPIMLIFGAVAMRAYHGYIRRLKSGELDETAHSPAPITDVVEGKDVE